MSNADNILPRPARRSWWSRHRAALVALAVLVPLTFGIIGVQEWWTRFQDRPVFPLSAVAGDTTAGATWDRVSLSDITSRVDRDIPEGARVLLVELRVIPEGEAVECATPALRERDGERREWEAGSSSLIPDDTGTVTRCPTDSAAPFEIAAAYVVPADASEALALDVTVHSIRPGFLRFDLER